MATRKKISQREQDRRKKQYSNEMERKYPIPQKELRKGGWAGAVNHKNFKEFEDYCSRDVLTISHNVFGVGGYMSTDGS